MASFIHIADEKATRVIRANGIKLAKDAKGSKGLYCFPVMKDYSLTHQWSRELKRTGKMNLMCVQFKIPDEEIVLIGKYNEAKVEMTAAEAVGSVHEHTDPGGLEIILSKKVLASQIGRIYPAPRLVGWRYYPAAKGRKPFCHCKFCNRGEIRAQRLIKDDA